MVVRVRTVKGWRVVTKKWRMTTSVVYPSFCSARPGVIGVHILNLASQKHSEESVSEMFCPYVHFTFGGLFTVSGELNSFL